MSRPKRAPQLSRQDIAELRGLEWLMEHLGLVTISLTRSDSWWRRWLGILLGTLCFCTMLPLVAWMQIFGKKPK